MNPMLNGYDAFLIRDELQAARQPYRQIVMVYPNITTGSNYDSFTDAPFDISSGSQAYVTATYTRYNSKARLKAVEPVTILGLGSSIPNVEVGDYLVAFRLPDKGQLQRVFDNKDAYILIDGSPYRPDNINLHGLALADEVMVHCKRFKPEFRGTGL